uniref:Uncharacterized protein n=1 Tax=Oryza punctata TaxID=4537 RepID=A0A0E0MF93_ORYPU
MATKDHKLLWRVVGRRSSGWERDPAWRSPSPSLFPASSHACLLGGTVFASRCSQLPSSTSSVTPRPHRRRHLQCARWGWRDATNRAATSPRTAEPRAVAAEAEAGARDGGNS